jgi:hypothetical protein
MVEAYGLRNVVFFPQYEGVEVDRKAAALLSLVGLPHTGVFASRIDPEAPADTETDPVAIGGFFDDGEGSSSCPPEARAWWLLGMLFTTVIALDPVSGKVYEFRDGESGYHLFHRDLESFLFALIEFRKLEVDHEDESLEPEELAERFTSTVGAFDPTPFEDEESQWNMAMEELVDEIW